MSTRYFPAAEIAAALLAGVTSFVEVHIWSPSYTYFLLLGLVVVDSLMRNKVQRRRGRPLHLGITLVAYTVVLAFAHGFGTHEIGLRWLPQVVLAPLVIFHLRRFVVNLSKLELMDEDVATLLNLKILKAQQKAEADAVAPPVQELPAEQAAGPADVVAASRNENSLEPAL